MLMTLSCLHAQAWNLPLEIDDTNSAFTFVVDSTWVTIHGTTKKNTGRIWQDPKHPENIQAELYLPVKNFETGMLMRDNHMHDIMESERFPNVEVKVNFVDQVCSKAEVDSNGECTFTQVGSLKIKETTRELTLKTTVTKINGKYIAKGSVKFSWKSFGVEDPSTFFASLDEYVTANYQIDLS